MGTAIKLAALVVAASAVAVGGWIGFRATETQSSRVCFGFAYGDQTGIQCMNPGDRDTYRLVGVKSGKLVSVP